MAKKKKRKKKQSVSDGLPLTFYAAQARFEGKTSSPHGVSLGIAILVIAAVTWLLTK